MNTTYTTRIEFSLRIQKFMFPLVVAISLIANGVFILFSLSTAQGIYMLLIYLIILQLLFEIADQGRRLVLQKDIENEPDIQLPFFDSVWPYVGVFLLWWVGTTLLFKAKIITIHGILAPIGLLLLVVIFVVLRFVVKVRPTALWIVIFRFVLRVFSSVFIFLPTDEWAPQKVVWVATFFRVVMFFGAAIIFNILIPNYPERSDDNILLVWWILVTPFYISWIALPFLVIFMFFTQTRLRLVFDGETPAIAPINAGEHDGEMAATESGVRQPVDPENLLPATAVVVKPPIQHTPLPTPKTTTNKIYAQSTALPAPSQPASISATTTNVKSKSDTSTHRGANRDSTKATNRKTSELNSIFGQNFLNELSVANVFHDTPPTTTAATTITIPAEIDKGAEISISTINPAPQSLQTTTSRQEVQESAKPLAPRTTQVEFV